MILKTIKNILEKLEKGMTLTKIINRCENAVKRDKVKRLQKKLINAQMYANLSYFNLKTINLSKRARKNTL